MKAGNKMDLNNIKALKRNLVILAMVELVGGLFLIIYNQQAMEMIPRVLGIIAAAYGLITLILWLFKKEKKENISMLITAILGIAAGACFIFLYGSMQDVFRLIAGIFAAVYGILKLPNMFKMKKAGFTKWYFLLIPIALIVALGIVIGLSGYNKGMLSDSAAAILLGVTFILGFAADITALAGTGEVEKALSVEGGAEAETPAITEEKEQ